MRNKDYHHKMKMRLWYFWCIGETWLM